MPRRIQRHVHLHQMKLQFLRPMTVVIAMFTEFLLFLLLLFTCCVYCFCHGPLSQMSKNQNTDRQQDNTRNRQKKKKRMNEFIRGRRLPFGPRSTTGVFKRNKKKTHTRKKGCEVSLQIPNRNRVQTDMPQ